MFALQVFSYSAKMKNVILIDGNNLAIRNAFNNSGLSVSLVSNAEDFNPDELFDEGVIFPTGVLHGFFQSIVSLKAKYRSAQIVVLWDSGYKNRLDLTTAAVSKGIIKEAYKENRKKKAMPKEIEDWQKQKPVLKQMLEYAGIAQLKISGEEADDIAASFVKKFSEEAKILICTQDEDYFQLLSPKVAIYRKEAIYTYANFKDEYGIEPCQWIDVGALCGDSGDNIFSAPGWGEKTAISFIKEHGTYQKALESIHAELDIFRTNYPDLDTEEKFLELKGLKTEKETILFPDIWQGIPFSGLAIAVTNKTCKEKIKKVKLTAMMYEERVHLAYQLKKMDGNLDFSFDFSERPTNRELLDSLCEKYKLTQVAQDAEIFFQNVSASSN